MRRQESFWSYLELLQLRSDGPLRLGEGGVAAFDAVVHLRHAVRGALAALCATAEHSALRERTGEREGKGQKEW